MTKAKPSIAREIARYLRTGDTDPHRSAWPSDSFMERSRCAREDLRNALVSEVRRLADGRMHRPVPDGDTVALTRRKVEPMVHGLFPRAEQATVMQTLEKSVVFVTSANMEALLLGNGFDHSVWDLANLYLASLGAKLLGKRARGILGMSEHTTCYVSAEYFAADNPFADFLVHEVAHIFHNCKRATVGLPARRTKEWLLNIDFCKRETFAYSCEAYARVLERATSAPHRRELAEEYGRTVRFPAKVVDSSEVASILTAAAAARNGWKVILARCAPAPRQRSARAALPSIQRSPPTA